MSTKMKNIYIFDKETLQSIPANELVFDIDTDELVKCVQKDLIKINYKINNVAKNKK